MKSPYLTKTDGVLLILFGVVCGAMLMLSVMLHDVVRIEVISPGGSRLMVWPVVPPVMVEREDSLRRDAAVVLRYEGLRCFLPDP